MNNSVSNILPPAEQNQRDKLTIPLDTGSRTKVTVNGKKAKRKKVKVGMTCTFTYPGIGMEAKKIDCKS